MPVKQEVEEAYATVAAAEKSALENFKEELLVLKAALTDADRQNIIESLPIMPGQPTPAQSLLRGYDAILSSWVGQIDSQLGQIELFLQPLEATLKETNGTTNRS